jgi:DNA-binding FrmR family transcriptional regulator
VATRKKAIDKHHHDHAVVQPRKDDLMKRMSRITGQVQGVARMVEEDRYCIDILNQINAVRAALDGVSMILLEDHTQHCIRDAVSAGKGEEHIKELIQVLRKYSR